MRTEDRDVVILSAVRTPSGGFQGGLCGLSATDLGAVVVRAAVERSGLRDLEGISEVILGNVVSAGLGQSPARHAAIRGGLPSSIRAVAVNKACGSGLKAVMLAGQAIRAGDGDIFLAGGMESMSRAPFLVDGRTGGLRFGHAQLRDSLVQDGLWCALENWAMGDAAEHIADEFEISREAMDEYAYRSHRKAIAAADSGEFAEEIVPVEVKGPKGQVRLLAQDETPRRDTSLAALAGLKPAFKKDGRVTAGNAPGLNDGAAALVVASRSKARILGVDPLARVVGWCGVGIEPRRLFAAPARAIPALLSGVGWTLKEVDLVELNEAFAAQVLANGKELQPLGWDWDRVNVRGGAIALGHPLGASGARVLTTLIHALRDRGLSRGIACLCLGGGEAVAMAIEAEALV